mgnify:CR=1 FL=1
MTRLSLSDLQLHSQQQNQYPGHAAPYPGGQAWGPPPQGALPPVGYPNSGYPPRPY